MCYFLPGPSQLPKEVIDRIQRGIEFPENDGLTFLEVSHRSRQFSNLLNEINVYFRDLLNIPYTHEVLFMHGGGFGQFAAVPLNLMTLAEGPPSADYFITGLWSKLAAKEAAKFLRVTEPIDPPLTEYNGMLYVVTVHNPGRYFFIAFPEPRKWKVNPDAAYAFYCANETIHGVEVTDPLETGRVPLVCDMSSNITTRKVDVGKFGVVFACTQKTLGIAGLAVVIVDKELFGHCDAKCPSIMNYTLESKARSCFNTPPVFAIYVLHLMLKFIMENGGIDEMERQTILKSKMIYDAIDKNRVMHKNRSRTTIPFQLPDEDLLHRFLSEADAHGLHGLEGHRTTGGIRVSLFHGVPLEATAKLQAFMDDFRDRYTNKE